MVEFVPYSSLPPAFYELRVNNLFYTDAWLSVLQRTYGYNWMTALDTETEQFVIFTVLNNLAGKKIISLPFSDYTPISTKNREASSKIIKSLRQQYPEHRVILKTELTADDPAFTLLGTPTRQAYYHRIDTANPDQIIQSSSFRRGVKKAQKSEVSVETHTDEAALQTFYRMYHQQRLQKFSSIPQPYSFFLNIYRLFITRERGFILQAAQHQRIIASIMVLQHQNIWYYKFGCSEPDTLEYRPNNLLFHKLIEIATERKCIAIDLGLSGAGSSYEGLIRFKESMGGVGHPITYFTCTPEGYDERSEKEFKTVLSSLTQTIVRQQLDEETTSELSSTLYPYFA